ncbi:MAG: hypothetical protein JNL57_02300 [Bacteroidetes bacterium]|nr:hypothetical protein [Bacteroidota bacterium]
MPHRILLISLFLYFPFLRSQLSCPCSPSSGQVLKPIQLNAGKDSVSLNKLILHYQTRGYLGASGQRDSAGQLFLFPGPQYAVVRISDPGQVAGDTLCLPPADLYTLATAWLQEMDNSGYPFARFQWFVSNIGECLLFQPRRDKGLFVAFDSVLFSGLDLSPGAMRRIAGIKPGEPYNQSKVDLLRLRLPACQGIMASAAPALEIRDGRLRLTPGIFSTNRDRLSLLAGLATSEVGRPVFTGEADAHFYNLFRNPYSAWLQWRGFRARSQELHLGTELPYLFGLPWVTSLQAGMEKLDTLYTRFAQSVAFRIPVTRQFRISVIADFVTRRGIYADVNHVQQFRNLPENPDSRNALYGMGLEWNSLNDLRMPVKGLWISGKASAGQRTILRDSRLETVQWTSSAGKLENVYDSLARTGGLKSNQYRTDVQAEWYLPVSRVCVVKWSAESHWLHLPVIYFNELGRYGGIKNMRGFNEQSIFANQFHMATAEARLLLAGSGFAGAFVSAGYWKNESRTGAAYGNPVSTGISAAIQTRAGILQLVWAVGSGNGQSMNLNNSKFHLGIANRF